MPVADTLALSLPSVLAVIVIHERGLDDVLAWPAIVAAMQRPHGGTHATAGLFIERVLVYDNSARARVLPAQVPPWADYRHDVDNGGTAAAYAYALREAVAHGIAWMLLLDHDTVLPDDLLPAADRAIVADRAHLAHGTPAAAVLPRVRHAKRPVSPSRITWSGSIRPIDAQATSTSTGDLTGIASGALVRVSALQRLGPLPRELWLDYVDHWMFVQLRRLGYRLIVSDAVLQHDLSVAAPRSLSARRLGSILDGEAHFVRGLGWPARLLHPMRLIVRALRLAPVVPPHAGAILRHLIGRARSAAR